jgi:hypothetical protein
MKKPGEEYLGDGLYSWFDCGMLFLRAPRAYADPISGELGPDVDHWVGLEPQVFREFIDFSLRQPLFRDIIRGRLAHIDRLEQAELYGHDTLSKIMDDN